MFRDITKPPPALPTANLVELQNGISLLPPLSMRGVGPGLILLLPEDAPEVAIIDGVPSQMMKWAEEGYAVIGIKASAMKGQSSIMLGTGIEALKMCEKCNSHEKMGLVVYEPELWQYVVPFEQSYRNFVGAVVYANASDTPTLPGVSMPVLRHLAGKRSDVPMNSEKTTEFYYSSTTSYQFANPFQPIFDYWAESLSHTRSLSFLKPLMNGPYFDLETIWDEHTYYEFADRSVEHTMSTMVDQPYVNHIPTLTGGIGREPLSKFYRHNFIFNNSSDTKLELISRTIGIDRVVDEFIFKFTHDQELDWMLPGVPPTHQYVEVPFTAVVNIRGDRLYHEHISWDQGTVLKQIGLLPEYLIFPSKLADSSTPNNLVEFRVPVAGVDTAAKLRDRNSVPSNAMFSFHTRDLPS